MIYLDSNIPMYLIGADHPNKTLTIVTLERLTQENQKLVTSTEVFQEILHRYTAIQKKDAIQKAYDVLLELTDHIFDITRLDIEMAKDDLLSHANISARDAIHIAVMKRNKTNTILSFDRGFDQISKITRIP